jgi:hypothetical protein
MWTNNAGRVLLSSTPQTPLSIWPTVLVRVNTLFVSIFQLEIEFRAATTRYSKKGGQTPHIPCFEINLLWYLVEEVVDSRNGDSYFNLPTFLF